jgi:hypothetical protein
VKLPNKAFSERPPEIAENRSFSQEFGTFRLFFLQTEGRSFAENDRSPSFPGAHDWWESARFLELVLNDGSFPFSILALPSSYEYHI